MIDALYHVSMSRDRRATSLKSDWILYLIILSLLFSQINEFVRILAHHVKRIRSSNDFIFHSHGTFLFGHRFISSFGNIDSIQLSLLSRNCADIRNQISINHLIISTSWYRTERYLEDQSGLWERTDESRVQTSQRWWEVRKIRNRDLSNAYERNYCVELFTHSRAFKYCSTARYMLRPLLRRQSLASLGVWKIRARGFIYICNNFHEKRIRYTTTT
jgi:hypothetical protein